MRRRGDGEVSCGYKETEMRVMREKEVSTEVKGKKRRGVKEG